jgi:very-short-patch-repair endonuclease
MAPIHTIAEQQHGLVSVEQLTGFTEEQRRHLVQTSRWERVTPVVLRAAGSPQTAHQRAMAAVLDAGAGATLSHRTGSYLWDLPGYAFEPFDVSRLRDRSDTPARLATLHHPRTLPENHITMVDGLPVTTPVRTIFDLANLSSKWQLHPDKVARTLDTAWAKRLVNYPLLIRTLDELAERGRGGIRLMRHLIGERGADYRPPESGLEARFQAIVDERGLGPLERQVDVGGEGQWLARVDFRDPRRPQLLVQIDSERYHGSLIDQRADEAQTAALTAAGFEVVRFTDVQVWHRPHEIDRDLRAARARINRTRSGG